MDIWKKLTSNESISRLKICDEFPFFSTSNVRFIIFTYHCKKGRQCFFDSMTRSDKMDIEKIDEIIFGSLSMRQRTNILKIHHFKNKNIILLSKIFINSSFHDMYNSHDTLLDLYVFDDLPSVDQRKDFSSLGITDMLYSSLDNYSKTNSIDRTEENILSSSAGSIYEASTNLKQSNQRKKNVPKIFSPNQNLLNSKGENQVAYSLLFHIPLRNSRIFKDFIITHSILIEKELDLLNDYFVKANHFEGSNVKTNAAFQDLLDRLNMLLKPCNISTWHLILSNPSSKLKIEKFLYKDFCQSLQYLCGRSSKFFLASFLTSVLTHHLSWTATLSQKNKNDELNENPIFNQIREMYGAVGQPITSCYIIIYCNSRRRRYFIEPLLRFITLFIRFRVLSHREESSNIYIESKTSSNKSVNTISSNRSLDCNFIDSNLKNQFNDRGNFPTNLKNSFIKSCISNFNDFSSSTFDLRSENYDLKNSYLKTYNNSELENISNYFKSATCGNLNKLHTDLDITINEFLSEPNRKLGDPYPYDDLFFSPDDSNLIEESCDLLNKNMNKIYLRRLENGNLINTNKISKLPDKCFNGSSHLINDSKYSAMMNTFFNLEKKMEDQCALYDRFVFPKNMNSSINKNLKKNYISQCNISKMKCDNKNIVNSLSSYSAIKTGLNKIDILCPMNKLYSLNNNKGKDIYSDCSLIKNCDPIINLDPNLASQLGGHNTNDIFIEQKYKLKDSIMEKTCNSEMLCLAEENVNESLMNTSIEPKVKIITFNAKIVPIDCEILCKSELNYEKLEQCLEDMPLNFNNKNLAQLQNLEGSLFCTEIPKKVTCELINQHTEDFNNTSYDLINLKDQENLAKFTLNDYNVTDNQSKINIHNDKLNFASQSLSPINNCTINNSHSIQTKLKDTPIYSDKNQEDLNILSSNVMNQNELNHYPMFKFCPLFKEAYKSPILRSCNESFINIPLNLLRGNSKSLDFNAIIQVTTEKSFIKNPTNHIKDFLRHSIINSLIGSSLESSLCILADLDNWCVQIYNMKCKQVADEDTKIDPQICIPSQLVLTLLESLIDISKNNLSSELWLSQLESGLENIVLKSHILTEFIIKHGSICSKETAQLLGFEINDLPLLLAVASTHSPQVANILKKI